MTKIRFDKGDIIEQTYLGGSLDYGKTHLMIKEVFLILNQPTVDNYSITSSAWDMVRNTRHSEKSFYRHVGDMPGHLKYIIRHMDGTVNEYGSC